MCVCARALVCVSEGGKEEGVGFINFKTFPNAEGSVLFISAVPVGRFMLVEPISFDFEWMKNGNNTPLIIKTKNII